MGLVLLRIFQPVDTLIQTVDLLLIHPGKVLKELYMGIEFHIEIIDPFNQTFKVLVQVFKEKAYSHEGDAYKAKQQAVNE
jgi:hypothetical protein